MKKLSFFIIFFLLISIALFAQVSINTDSTAPDNSSMLDVKSSTRGLLIPRMTTAERNSIATPASSLMIFNTTTRCFEAYDQITSSWENIHCLGCPLPASPLAGTHLPSQEQIIWNWNPVSGATGYKWNTSNNYDSAADMGTSITKTEMGLTCNTAYTRYIWAYKVCGNSTSMPLTQSTFACGWTCGQSFSDSRDGKTYKTVQVGSQCWMAQNMNFDDGYTPCYDYNEANCDTYGRLYAYDASLGACPSGWHLPSAVEWTILTDFVNNQPAYRCNNNFAWIGKAMASTTLWDSSTTTCDLGNNLYLNNRTGFSALPGGWLINGSFHDKGNYGSWWSSDENNYNDAWIRRLQFNGPKVYGYSVDKYIGLSVRCLRDN
jgi:uncharacterized protein (TIGR02145 family)